MYQKVVSIPAGRDRHYFSPPASARNGLGFEEYIFRQISVGGGSVGSDLRFQRSPRTGDDGKDIIIEGDLRELLGQRLHGHRGKTICEVKYSSGGLLKLSRFADTLMRVEKDVCDVVIISNNTPSPRTIYHARKQIELIGKRLHFISGTDLNLHFSEQPDKLTDHMVCIQLDERTYPNKIHFYIKNLSSSQTRNFLVDSKRDEETRTKKRLEYLLGPGEFYAGQAELLDVGDRVESNLINFDVAINDRIFDVVLSRHLDTNTITLPFWGSANLEHLADCKAALSDNFPSPVLMVEGGAGVGKSRFVQELARSVRSLGRPVLIVDPPAMRSVDSLEKIVKRESEYLHSQFRKSGGSDPIARLFEMLENDELNAAFLVFEDAHLFSETSLKSIRDHIGGTQSRPRPSLMFTARNDDTFFNPGYFIFAEFVRSEVIGSKAIFLRRLPQDEERNLIHHVVSHVPNAAVERVQYLSNGNPFHLILTLEWLVENDLFQIVNNQRIAVVDSKRFADQSSLPVEIDDMFKQSFSTLNEHLSEDFMALLSMLALHPGFTPRANDLAELPLFQTNAFLDSFEISDHSWRHDLAKTAFLRLVLEDKEYSEIRLRMLELAQERKVALSANDLARLAYFCGDDQLAWSSWSELRSGVLAIENITSIDFDPAYFDSFVHFAELSFERGETRSATQALVVWCYLGCHYANLTIGQTACEKSLMMLQKHVPDQFPSEVNAIKALELRSLIDSGLVNQARSKVLECEIALAKDQSSQKSVHLFDYHLNRSDLQRLLNDRTGALHFLESACREADTSLGPLEFVELSHRTALENDPVVRSSNLKRLVGPGKPHGSERHLLIAKCMLVRTQFLSLRDREDSAETEVSHCLARARKMVDRQFMSALPIAYRAAAIAAYCAYIENDFDPRAVRDLYRLAENSCVLKGEAESLPLVLNDLAIVEQQITGRLQDAMMFLATAIDVLNRQGRLDLGNTDLTSANQIIVSNYLRMISSSNYAQAVDFAMDRVQWSAKSEASSRGWVTRELDRMNDTGMPFLSNSSGMYLLKSEASGLSLVG